MFLQKNYPYLSKGPKANPRNVIAIVAPTTVHLSSASALTELTKHLICPQAYKKEVAQCCMHGHPGNTHGLNSQPMQRWMTRNPRLRKQRILWRSDTHGGGKSEGQTEVMANRLATWRIYYNQVQKCIEKEHKFCVSRRENCWWKSDQLIHYSNNNLQPFKNAAEEPTK